MIERELTALAALRSTDADTETRLAKGLRFSQLMAQAEKDAWPKLLKHVNPKGFEGCLKASSTGRVYITELEFDIRPDGSVANAAVIAGDDPCLDRYAVKALSRWRFEPPMQDGEPTARTGIRTAIRFDVGR
jgi:TonB family protein